MTKKNSSNKKHLCKLPPYEVEEVLTLDEVKQKLGWEITAFNLPDAWSITQGEGVKIAICDTGCDLDHPDLVGNLLPGINFVQPGTPPNDDNQHGCVSPDCLVHTNFCGIETIENLFNRLNCNVQEITDKDGTYQIKNLKGMGIKTYSFNSDSQKTEIGEIESIQKLPIVGEIVEIELQGNICYSLTPWHPVYTIKNKHHNVYEIIRKRADEIIKGDWFVFPRGNNSGRLVNEPYRLRYGTQYICNKCGHIPKYFLNGHPSKCKKCLTCCWKINTKEILINSDLAYLAGIVLTDGYIGKDRFEVSSETIEILEKVKLIADRFGWTNAIDKQRILVYGKEGTAILSNLGIFQKNKSLTQTLPEFVGKSPYDVICAFIAGVVDGDGCISPTNTSNRITTGSKNFAQKMCSLLNSIGLSSSINGPCFDKRKNRKIKSDNPIYNIVFPSVPEEIHKLFCHPNKKERSNVVPKYRRVGRIVKNIKRSNYNGYFYDFTIKDYHNYIGNGHFVSNTHVAGIICAKNNEIGMVGAAPLAKIIPVKVLNAKGGGDLNVVAQGIRWSADNGADIISMSLGSPRPLAGIRKAIQYAETKGIPVFVAAGNAGQTKEVFYPANYPETIAVGSIDENFDRSNFSNTGDRLDFMAPGGKIFSTVPDNWYAYFSGTSMACPFVVGIAALCLSYQRQHGHTITGAEQFRQLFRKHTIPISNPSFAGQKFFQGFGIIDTRDFKKWIETNL